MPESQGGDERRSCANLFGCVVLLALAGGLGLVAYRGQQMMGKLPISRQQAERYLKLQFPADVRVRCYYQLAPPGQVAAEALLTKAEFEEFRQINGLRFRPVSTADPDLRRYVQLAQRVAQLTLWEPRGARILLDDGRIEVADRSATGSHVERPERGPRPPPAFANQAIMAYDSGSGEITVLCLRWG